MYYKIDKITKCPICKEDVYDFSCNTLINTTLYKDNKDLRIKRTKIKNNIVACDLCHKGE